MSNPAVIVRPQSVKTSAWIRSQSDAIRRNTGRRIGYGPLLESIANGLVEAGVDFCDCRGMSDIASKLVRLLNARFAIVQNAKGVR
jgi:hypothetical protein